MTAREFFRAAKKHRPLIEDLVLDILDKSKLVKITKKEEIVKVEKPELAPFLKLIDPENGEEVNYDQKAVEELLLKVNQLETVSTDATEEAEAKAKEEADKLAAERATAAETLHAKIAENAQQQAELEKYSALVRTIKGAKTLEDALKALPKTTNK